MAIITFVKLSNVKIRLATELMQSRNVTSKVEMSGDRS